MAAEPDQYRPRVAAAALERLLRTLPVAVVTGARQTGKSRLVTSERALRGYEFRTLDDLSTRLDAEHDPHGFVAGAEPLIIDEVQRVPPLLLAVKAAVDREQQRKRGRFVLTGSANLLLMKEVSESLAGRAGYLRLEPMTRRELAGEGAHGVWPSFFETPVERWQDVLLGDRRPAPWTDAVRRGGFPYPALRLRPDERSDWFTAYVDTYLERDLRQLSQVADLADFRRVMRAFAIRTGDPVNHAEVARELGLVARTVRRWVDLLDISYQLVRLPAFTLKASTRLRKRPKHYWNDAGLALHLSGQSEPSGVHLETLVFGDLRAWAALDTRRPSLMYWRDEADREVDLVAERDGKALAIEVKTTTNPHYDDWANLIRFTTEYRRRCIGALLLHCGNRTFRPADGVLAVPWWRVL